MKKRRFRLLTILFASMFVFTGCGTPLYELTPDEENIISKYAAYALAKYNTYQKDGMNAAKYVVEGEETEPSTQQKKDDVTDPDAEVNASKPSGDKGKDNSSKYTDKISLGKCMGSKKLSVKYTDYKVASAYQEGGYYSLDADSGKKFVVLNFIIKNNSSKNVKVDAVEQDARFQADFGDGNWVSAEETFLAYSLTTYQGTIKSGKSVKAILLFQIPKEKAEKISKPSLGVKLDGKSYLVKY